MSQDSKMRGDLPTVVEQAINGHPGYAEFAAWCKSQLIHPHQIYFLVWRASREAVVVELPARKGESTRGNGFNEALTECRAAIEAQGLKVAG